MADIQFNPREQLFISKVMKPFDALVAVNPALHDDFLQQVMGKQLNAITSTAARNLIESILFKLAMHNADTELELMLSDPSYGEDFTGTKVASHRKLKQGELAQAHSSIINTLKGAPGPLSRAEIAEHTGLRVSSVCARVQELIDENLVRVVGTKEDKVTKRKVQILEVT